MNSMHSFSPSTKFSSFVLMCLFICLHFINTSNASLIRREEEGENQKREIRNLPLKLKTRSNMEAQKKSNTEKTFLSMAQEMKKEQAQESEKEETKVIVTDNESALSGNEFLAGIREIIGRDGLLSENDLQYKPFMGSFANIKSDSDPMLQATAYCMTDNHCGHFEAYSESNVALSDLACNKFCYIDSNTKYYATSQVYTIDNPPETYLCCGWETCG